MFKHNGSQRHMRRAWLVAPLAAALGASAAVPGVAVPLAAQESGAEDRDFPALMLVLDASGSMDDPAGSGGTRMEAAEEALAEVAAAVPDGVSVGLRVLGGERSGDASCQDTRVAIPPGPIDSSAMASAVAELEPQGDTPLADSLELAGADLPDDQPGMIVVVTDGKETCGGDPCAIAGQLVDSGVDVRVDVVGFQVADDERAQLKCIADAGEGTYVDAPDADALAAQLHRLAVRGLRLFTPGGTPVQGTPAAQGAPVIADGRFVDDLDGEEPKHYEIDVPEGQTLWAAASIRPMLAGRSSRLSIEVEVLSADGTQCERERSSATGAWHASLPLTAMVGVSAESLEECGRPPYSLRTQLEGIDEDDARAVELFTGFEAGVETVDDLPRAARDRSFDVELTTGSAPVEPVIGSPSIASAPVVEPGRYSDTILVGETLYYAVELDWGQQFVCQPTLGPSEAVVDGLTGNRPTAWTRLFGPFRGSVIVTSTGEGYTGAEEVTDSMASPPVLYRNRERTNRRAAAIPGTYYCAVTLEGRGGNVGLGEVPLEVAIDVAGEAGAGAPQYLAESEPEPTDSANADAGSAETTTTTDSSGVPSWLPVVGPIVLGLLVAAAALVFARRRKASRRDVAEAQGPGDPR